MTYLAPQPKFKAFYPGTALPLIGGKLYSYIAGTTTPQNTYKDSAGTLNANPVILNASGECDLWLGAFVYKFVLKDIFDNTIWTVDNIQSIDSLVAAAANATQNVSSVLALRSVTPSYIGQQFNLLGHTLPGVGGGVFYYAGTVANTSSDNDGTIIVSSVGGVFYQFIRKDCGDLYVEMFGARGDGATDDQPKIQAALNNLPFGTALFLTQGKTYRIGSALTVPAGKSIIGKYGATSAASGVPCLIGDLAVSPIITLDGGGASSSVGAIGFTVDRQAGSVPAGSVGVLIQNSNQPLICDIFSRRSAITISINGNAQVNVSVNLVRVNTSAATDTHVFIQDSVETHFDHCRFGRNGGVDVNCNSYFKIDGNVVDTVSFIGCQFNMSAATATFMGYWSSYTNPNGIFKFVGCHGENMLNVFGSDAASSPQRIQVSGANSFTATNNLFTGFTGAQLSELMISGGNIINCGSGVTFDQIKNMNVVGNRFVGPVVLNACGGVFNDNTCFTGVTSQGTMVGFTAIGNVLDGAAQVWTDTSTGSRTIHSNNPVTSANNLLTPQIFGGEFVQFGGAPKLAFKQITGFANGSGTVSISHTIPNGAFNIEDIQCFTKNGSAQAVPMVLTFFDATGVVFTGALAGGAYRMFITYTAGNAAW